MTATAEKSVRVTRPRVVAAAAVLVVVAAVVTVVLVISGGDDAVRPPYTDAAAQGVIGLCDASGNPVRSGSTTSGPLARRAVGATAASGGYAADGRTATLYAFQPRAGVDPASWSGRQLGAASRYTNVSHPMAQLTSADATLASFVTAYPARQDGFVQLRLYLGAPGQPPADSHYDATDIRVTGTTWRVVRGGDLDCKTGSATSFEDDVRPTSSSSR